MNIEIDVSATRTSGQNILNNVSDIRSQIKVLENMAERLGTIWQSEDGKNCSNALKESYVAQLNDLANVLEAYGNYLKLVGQVYTTLDDSFNSKSIGA